MPSTKNSVCLRVLWRGTWGFTCLVPRRFFLDENVRAREGGKEATGETAVCTLPMVPCGSSPVTHLYLAKNEAPEEEAGGLWYCGIELFFKQYFGYFDFNVQYCGIRPALRYHSSFWLTVFGKRRSFTILRYRSFGLSCLM